MKNVICICSAGLLAGILCPGVIAAGKAVESRPNMLIIVPDDQRWDASGFMQQRMESLGRVARFPWFIGHTPGMDRLSREGIHFDNAFVTHSICSPSRASMLTGRYAHQVGIVDNQTYFPVDTVTYATLLRDAGYATGYFGKWHMHDQPDRPGFDTVATFRNQGNYYGNTFWVNGTAVHESGWVDDVSTDYLLQFIEQHSSADSPFLAFIGFKTPHDNRTPPDRYRNLFAEEVLIPVPSMGGAAQPPFRPNASAGTGLNDNRNYFRTLAGADDNVVRMLDLLDELGIADNTVVIYLSDNGYYLGEHGLGDKRSAYEESMRIPLMIRYPRLQTAPRIADELVLNLDLAPTILQLAGLPVPDWMEGRSLLPIITGEQPADGWREQFFFVYARDPAYPTSTPALIALRNSAGEKLVYYPFSDAWTEMFNTVADPHEVVNLYSEPSQRGRAERLARDLNRLAWESGFLRLGEPYVQSDALSAVVTAAAGFHFSVERSVDLQAWDGMEQFKGNGRQVDLALSTPPAALNEWQITGDAADYALAKGPPVQAVSAGSPTLRVGANTNNPAGGRNTVLVFQLPVLPTGQSIASAELQVTAWRPTAAPFNGDLWALGIYDSMHPVLDYGDEPVGNSTALLIQQGFLDTSLSSAPGRVHSDRSNPALLEYLRGFYASQPGYAGGHYLFLRINPDADPGMADIYYTVNSADAAVSNQPQLVIELTGSGHADTPVNRDGFYRVRLVDPGLP